VAWEETQFGDYPFSSTGGLVTGTGRGFSLEDASRPTYSASAGLSTMVHELAHQWFGDSVSVHHWADVWLNEGFATYMEHRWTETHGGPATSRWLREAYDSNAAGSSFWDLVVADPGPRHLFDWPVYERGGMTLAALRNRIGDRAFGDVLRRWTAERRYGHGTTDAFESLAESVSGEDLTSFFDAWVHEPERPADIPENGL